MATQVKKLMRGHEARLTDEGWEITEKKLIKRDVTKGEYNGSDGFGVLMRIVQDESDTRFQIGGRHPYVADAFLKEIIPVPLNNGDIEISYIYRENRHNKIRVHISGNAREVETNQGRYVQVDSRGEPGIINGKFGDMSVEYDYPSDHPSETYAGKKGEVTGTGHLSSVLWPGTRITITADKLTTYQQIVDDSLDYVGTLNSAPWRFVNGNYAYIWQCMDISGQTLEPYRKLDEKQWYEMTYVFEYINVGAIPGSPRGFRKAVYIDPTTGKPPKDAKWKLDDDANGARYVTGLPPGAGPVPLASKKLYLLEDVKDFNAIDFGGRPRGSEG